MVDVLATLFTIFGWFVGGRTSIVAVIRVWAFSFGVFCVMAGVHYRKFTDNKCNEINADPVASTVLQGSQGFDNLMHGKSIKKDQKQRSIEDFGKFLTRP